MYLLLIPLAFMAGVFGFHALWQRTRKDINNNPVIFKDGGNIWLYVMSWVCMLGFAVSLFWVGQLN